MSSQSLLRCVLAIALVLCATIVSGHAIHISFMEASWEGNVLAGKVSFYKDDYLKALAAWSGKEISGWTTPELGKLECRYFANYFRVWRDGISQQLPILIGRCTDDNASFTFEFSFTVPQTAHSLTLDNQVLFKQYSDETNLLLLRHAGRQYNFSFTPSSTTFVIAKT